MSGDAGEKILDTSWGYAVEVAKKNGIDLPAITKSPKSAFVSIGSSGASSVCNYFVPGTGALCAAGAGPVLEAIWDGGEAAWNALFGGDDTMSVSEYREAESKKITNKFEGAHQALAAIDVLDNKLYRKLVDALLLARRQTIGKSERTTVISELNRTNRNLLTMWIGEDLGPTRFPKVFRDGDLVAWVDGQAYLPSFRGMLEGRFSTDGTGAANEGEIATAANFLFYQARLWQETMRKASIVLASSYAIAKASERSMSVKDLSKVHDFTIDGSSGGLHLPPGGLGGYSTEPIRRKGGGMGFAPIAVGLIGLALYLRGRKS